MRCLALDIFGSPYRDCMLTGALSTEWCFFSCPNSFHTVSVHYSLAFYLLGYSLSREPSRNLVRVQSKPVANAL